MPTVASPNDLNAVRASGYYAYHTQGSDSQLAVAYVAAPGDWASAPKEIKQLPLASNLLPIEIASKRMVIYGPGTLESGPWPADTGAPTLGNLAATVQPAAASDCTSPWFWVFTNSGFSGTKCEWQSTGTWQGMPSNCIVNAESMVNRRNAWSLLKRASDDANYCAQPNSQDASLASNGFANNTYETYNSTSTTQLSAWSCAN